MKIFYANLKFINGILKSSLKGVDMEITRKTWKNVVGLRQEGVQVREGDTTTVDDSARFNISINVCAILVSKHATFMWEAFVWKRDC